MLKPEEFGLTALRHIEVMSEKSAAAWPTILGLEEIGSENSYRPAS